MSAEENKVLIRNLFEEVWNKRNIDAIDEVETVEGRKSFASTPDSDDGEKNYKQYVTLFICD